MYSWNQIQKMSKEEIARANRKLIAKVVLYRIVLPIAAVGAVIAYQRHLDKNSEANQADPEN